MYQYNSIMSAVNDFIDEVNESDSEAKLIKPHTIKEAYELLAGYYGKETGKALLEEYESGRPHDVADATKLLLDVMKNKTGKVNISSESPIGLFYYTIGDFDVLYSYQNVPDGYSIMSVPEGTKLVSMCCVPESTALIFSCINSIPFTHIDYGLSDLSSRNKGHVLNRDSSEIVIDGETYYYFSGLAYNPRPTMLLPSIYWPDYNTSGFSSADATGYYIAKYAIMCIKYGTQIDIPSTHIVER